MKDWFVNHLNDLLVDLGILWFAGLVSFGLTLGFLLACLLWRLLGA